MKITINLFTCIILLIFVLLFSNDIHSQTKDSISINLNEKYNPLTKRELKRYRKSLEYIDYLDKKTGNESKKIRMDYDKKKFEEAYKKELGKKD